MTNPGKQTLHRTEAALRAVAADKLDCWAFIR